MAFEGTKQGMRDFLAVKQAGAHPLAQHLNFKSALKEARMARAFKSRESEIQRGHQERENQLDRESAEGISAGKTSGIGQIKELQQEAKSVFQKAKTEVEKMILGKG